MSGSVETVSHLGEKRIVREIIKPICTSGRACVGVGDDSAVLDFPAGEQLLASTDKIPEDLLAIQLGLMSAFQHGRYLAIVNISDIAAMGGKPIGLLCTLVLPNGFSLEYLRQFMRGFVAGGAEWNVPVVGGDTGWGSSACFSATALGSVESGRALLRSGAQPGDKIFVSGTVGGFGTALAYFIAAKPSGFALSNDEEAWLKHKLVNPTARVDIGRVLSQTGTCTSCMDITDGVGQSLRELAEASDLHFVVYPDRLPVSPITHKVANFLGKKTQDIVFWIGLDLELIGTVTAVSRQPDLHLIGEVREGRNQVSVCDGEHVSPLDIEGWQHFVGSAMEMVRKQYSG